MEIHCTVVNMSSEECLAEVLNDIGEVKEKIRFREALLNDKENPASEAREIVIRGELTALTHEKVALIALQTKLTSQGILLHTLI